MYNDTVIFEVTFPFRYFIENTARADEEHQQRKKKNVFFVQIQDH